MTTKAGLTSDAARGEDDLFPRASGRPTITLTLGGVSKTVQQLSARGADAWKQKMASELAGRFTGVRTLDNVESLAAVFAGLQDVQVELLLAYDAEGRLGGADWILDNATPSEIWTAFKAVVVAANPFLDDAMKAKGLVGLYLPQLVALLGSKPSTSGDANSAS